MNVLVDTNIWSLAFRKSSRTANEPKEVQELIELINENRVAIIGLIRQELLSGITIIEQFQRLKEYLVAFEDLALGKEVYELAAEYFNLCRKHGVQGSHIDFLICASAFFYQIPIFTNDKDFIHFAKYLPIKIYKAR